MSKICHTLIAACFITGLTAASVNVQLYRCVNKIDAVNNGTCISDSAIPAQLIRVLGLDEDLAGDVMDVVIKLNDGKIQESYDDETVKTELRKILEKDDLALRTAT